jgi:hypothetical protein
LFVRRSKNEAGTRRRPPIPDNPARSSRTPGESQGRRREGKVIDRFFMFGEIARRLEKARHDAGLRRITLHECRY